jgi:hypothetical protein
MGDSIARWAVDAASAAVLYLFSYLSKPTDVIFPVVAPAYNRVLAMSLLLSGGVIAFALVEQILGGRHGAGPEVVVRALAASAAAMLGLPLMKYAVVFSDLLATIWNVDVAGGAALASHVSPAFHAGSGQAFGSALGLFLAALLTVLLAILVHLELVLRAALLALTTTLLPLACVMAIWPRLAGTLGHMTGFLLALLLSKFVVATAIYLGFAMVVQSFARSAEPSGALMTGLAALTAAVFAPIVLLQGVRFAEAGAAHATRGFTFAAARAATGAGAAIGRRLRAAGLGRAARSAVQRHLPSVRTRTR